MNVAKKNICEKVGEAQFRFFRGSVLVSFYGLIC